MTDTLDIIKNLREITGAGFLDCKKALLENNNNIDASVDFLRKKGLSKASKKINREAKEGAVGIYNKENQTVVLKINSETDFAAKSYKFLEFMDKIGNISFSINKDFDKDSFLDTIYKGKKISEYFTDIISVIGENIVLSNINKINHKDLNFNFYVHNAYKSNIGKIISSVVYKTSNNDHDIVNFTKNICMHIAASKPEAIDIESLDPELILKEKNFQLENIKSSGKPENIIQKILEGKMKKFYSDSTLLNQNYVLDADKTVKQVINDLPKKYDFKLVSYNLMVLG